MSRLFVVFCKGNFGSKFFFLGQAEPAVEVVGRVLRYRRLNDVAELCGVKAIVVVGKQNVCVSGFVVFRIRRITLAVNRYGGGRGVIKEVQRNRAPFVAGAYRNFVAANVARLGVKARFDLNGVVCREVRDNVVAVACRVDKDVARPAVVRAESNRVVALTAGNRQTIAQSSYRIGIFGARNRGVVVVAEEPERVVLFTIVRRFVARDSDLFAETVTFDVELILIAPEFRINVAACARD